MIGGDGVATVVKNISQLQKVLQGRIKLALRFTQREISKVIQSYINRYYHEYNPLVYERTWQFLNGLIETTVVVKGNVVSCEVKMSDSLSYKQPASVVLDMINRGMHADKNLRSAGYKPPYSIVGEVQFWDDAIEELGGEQGIYNLLKKNLNKVGLSVH